jgi:hypothetical protein
MDGLILHGSDFSGVGGLAHDLAMAAFQPPKSFREPCRHRAGAALRRTAQSEKSPPKRNENRRIPLTINWIILVRCARFFSFEAQPL